jgi:hypothetical protein
MRSAASFIEQPISLGDVREIATAQAGHLVGPGDEHLVGALQHVGAQDRRAGDVGIDVESDLLPLHRLVELAAGSRSCGRSWSGPEHLWCETMISAPARRPISKVSSIAFRIWSPSSRMWAV